MAGVSHEASARDEATAASGDEGALTVYLAWTRTVDPASGNEPVTRAEAKAHLKVDHTADDTLIDNLIVAARDLIEEYTSRGLFTQTWKLMLDDWPEELWLPRAGVLQSITSVKYYNTSGTLTTLATTVYDNDTTAEPARIVRKPDQSWPALQGDRRGRIEVIYVVGWSAVSGIPQAIKQAALLIIGHWYLHREAVNVSNIVNVMPFAADALLSPYRIWWRPPTYAAA